MSFIYSMTDTWNAIGTTFTAIKMNVTDTASAAASLLMDLQVGGSSQFKIARLVSNSENITQYTGDAGSGGVILRANNTNATGYSEVRALTSTLDVRMGASATAFGYFNVVSNAYFAIYTNNTEHMRILAAGNTNYGPNFISFGSAMGNEDLYLGRDAANALALRNGTNAQVFRVYNTFTDASNYERCVIGYSSNRLQIGHQIAGTGSSRSVDFFGQDFAFKTTDGIARWYITSSGHLITDAETYDIGTTNANRPRDLFLARSLYPGMVVKYASLTLASLSASVIGAASAGAGAMAYISDGNVPVVFTTVAGGGTTPCPVYSDGTQWRAG